MNHKNFVNLIGYCEEDEPFVRMMVFEYAPNGTLFEHLHGNCLLRSFFYCKFLVLILVNNTSINLKISEAYFLFNLFSVKEVEHLDWNARMRIVMGTAYCLQYMHHELNPPVAHPSLTSHSIFLTDDYAAKVFKLYSTDS